jgi:hypothetical protein
MNDEEIRIRKKGVVASLNFLFTWRDRDDHDC